MGGYLIGKFIGKGGVGSVYEATGLNDGGLVAIKLMRQNPFITPQLLSTIVDSSLATQKISSEAKVVKVLDGGCDGDIHYIVMELFRNGTLRRLIDDSGLDLKEKLRAAISIMETLELVHAQGIIHGDLKPTNLLLGDDGIPFLNDFYHFPGKAQGVGMLPLPQGTPSYMSPEQAQGQFVNFSTDIYSFGVLLYELLTGSFPTR